MAKKNLRDRLKQKQKELKEKGSNSGMIFIKPDQTYRVRILNVGEENEFVQEITQFYLGSEIKGVISPSTFDEPCAIAESYDELKNSDDDSDKDLAKGFAPRPKYVALVILYKDEKGKVVDEQNSEKLILLTSGVYEDILELYLDEDEWGDMTNPKKGYDIKIKRTGSGKMDTEYTVTACKNTPTPAPYDKKVYDLTKKIKEITPSYEETKSYINQFLGLDDDDKPKKKKKKLKKKSDLG